MRYEDLTERRARLKKKLRARETCFAGWTSFGEPQITEVFANAPFDFIGIDIEHGTTSFQQSQRIIAAAQAGGTLCLPRIASHSMEMIKRLLDSGADGIIVPMVENAAQVKNIVDWVKYPPLGKRSFGVNRGQNYGFDFDRYVADWNRSSVLVVQIESMEGVKNIDEILSFEEIDAVMVGPYDLSGSLGIPGQIEHPRLKEAAQRVIDAAKQSGRGCGSQLVEFDGASIQDKLKQGYSFIVLASDVFLLKTWTEKTARIINDSLVRG